MRAIYEGPVVIDSLKGCLSMSSVNVFRRSHTFHSIYVFGSLLQNYSGTFSIYAR